MTAVEFFEVAVDGFTEDDFVSANVDARFKSFFLPSLLIRARIRAAFALQVWVDIYLHNQFARDDRGSEMLIEKFDSLIVGTGRVVAVMSWWDPEALKRMWCLYELVCGLRGEGVKLELMLSNEQRQGLISAVRWDHTVVT